MPKLGLLAAWTRSSITSRDSESNVDKEHLWDPAVLLGIQWRSILTLTLFSS